MIKARANRLLDVVSGYASGNRFCLVQEADAEKRKEMTAIPALLKLLAVKDCIITNDAMGC